MPVALPYQFQFSADALAKTIGYGVWNESYHYFGMWLLGAGPRLMTVIFASLSLALLVVLRVLQAGEYARPRIQALGFALVIGVCVVTPTLGLEAMSNVWTPGTRWPMIMQFWSPFLFCIVVFSAASPLPDRLWPRIWQAGLSFAAAFIIALALGFNHTQVIHVRQERAFFAELRTLVAQDRASGAEFPRRYVIQAADPAPVPPAGRLADAYAHTLLAKDVKF